MIITIYATIAAVIFITLTVLLCLYGDSYEAEFAFYTALAWPMLVVLLLHKAYTRWIYRRRATCEADNSREVI
jgi:hypothetical protein